MARILIIDDDNVFRAVVGKHLADLGYEVAFAANGWEGFLELDRLTADLLIVDGVMPGMDGPTFLKILRNDPKRRALPVIMMTAHNPLDVKSSVGENEVSAILAKEDAKFIPKLTVAVQRILPETVE